jgi:hypothetical protein
MVSARRAGRRTAPDPGATQPDDVVYMAEDPQKADRICAANGECVPITDIWRSFSVCALGGESKGACARTFSIFLDFNSLLRLQILNIGPRTGPFGQVPVA